MKVSALVASGGSGLITPAHTPPFTSFSLSIPYITEWNLTSCLSHLLSFTLLPLPLFLVLLLFLPLPAAKNLHSPLCPPFNICLPPPRPTVPWTSISPLPAPWKCHILKRRGCSNLKGRLKRHDGKTALSPPLSLTLSPGSFSCRPPTPFSCHVALFATCFHANISSLFMNLLQFSLYFVCPSLSLPLSPSFVMLLLIDPQEPCLIYETWAIDVTVRNQFQAVSLSFPVSVCVSVFLCVSPKPTNIQTRAWSVFISSNLMVLKMAACWQMCTAP